MAYNNKFGHIQMERPGHHLEDEPCFILMASDPDAVMTAALYVSARLEDGLEPAIAADLAAAINEMIDWRRDHGVVLPDAGEY
jgi:hypothetical protein